MTRKAKKIFLILLTFSLLFLSSAVHAAAPANGWYKTKSGTYYYKKSKKVTGWKKISGKKYYFQKPEGKMATGLVKIGEAKYYFAKNGQMQKGWIKSSKGKRYFDENGAMYVSTVKEIDGIRYKFNSSGYAKKITVKLTKAKTLKNYLIQAIQPIGKTLYVWGGGWGDATRKGLSPTMTKWYNSQKSDYDFNDYKDLSYETRAKGFDCSGFVGWASYQGLHSASGQGYGYTVVSGNIGDFYTENKLGKVLSPKKTIHAGDIGFTPGHTWISLGSCSDGSIVILHSLGSSGVQLSGTYASDENVWWGSEAIELVNKYMDAYPGINKYTYMPIWSIDKTYGSYVRWDDKVLPDPDNIRGKSAEEVLKIIFGY